MLLRLEAVHVDWQFGRRDHLRQKHEFPARQLRAITQIQILRERVVLPAARLCNTALSPKPSGAVEIKETTAPAARRLL